MGTALLTLGLAAAVAIAGTVLVRMIRDLLESRLGTVEEGLKRQLIDVHNGFDRRLADLHEGVDRRLEGLDGRLLSNQQNAGQTATQIVERLVKLDGTAAQMLQKAADLGRLEQALRPPKARGGVGEMLLGNLLRDMLPADAYRLQHTFRSGERVDAVIRVDKLVPVDAKFPLDNFERVANAEGDAERELHEKAFARDVKGHIDAIAGKYIRPAEGTFDFAFMYLPSESVYYELVCGKTGNLSTYAHDKRVIPVSPSTFHAYLLMVTQGLRALQIERHAQEVMTFCAQMGKDFERFRGDFEVVGKHIANAQSKYGEADRRLSRLGASLERATEWEPEQLGVETAQPPELPRALDAA
ncbi:MAG: DNA recombination protein RmuC [Actinobacteria bacterium]|nr:DNA recombination protein RmuC [Actinomycetota bacterium]